MRYEVVQGADSFSVDVQEVGPHCYDVSIDDGDPVRIDAFDNPRSGYSLLLGTRQFEASVDARDDGRLDVHVGSSAFDITAIDERKKMLAGMGGTAPTGTQTIRAQMPGKVVKLLVALGASVDAEGGLLILEAMKMENEIKSPIAGVVSELAVGEGDSVETDQLLCVVDPPEGDG